jgi:hypothetical protein
MNIYEVDIGHGISCYGVATIEAADDSTAIALAQSELNQWHSDGAGTFEAESTTPEFDTAFNHRVLCVRRMNPENGMPGHDEVDICGELLPSKSEPVPRSPELVTALQASKQLVGHLLRLEQEIAMDDLNFLRRLPDVLAHAGLIPLQELLEVLDSALVATALTAD